MTGGGVSSIKQHATRCRRVFFMSAWRHQQIAGKEDSIMVLKLAWLGLAGACGTLARYGLAGLVHKWFGGNFPWGTASVNVLGCLLFGIVWAAGSERAMIGPEMRTILLVGFMGSFTTFSTLVSESSHLLADAQLLLGFTNIALQLVAGTGGFFLGLAIGRII
jgi:CrcB protein